MDSIAAKMKVEIACDVDGDTIPVRTPSKSNNKKRSRHSRLPPYMVLDASKGKWHFVKNDEKKVDISGLLDKYNGTTKTRLEGIPVLASLAEKDYWLYADEEGMMRQPALAMNLVMNPFCDDNYICSMAMIGGPYGSMVLHKSGGISGKLLYELCAKRDKKDLEEDEDDSGTWVRLLKEALEEIGQDLPTTLEESTPNKKNAIDATSSAADDDVNEEE